MNRKLIFTYLASSILFLFSCSTAKDASCPAYGDTDDIDVKSNTLYASSNYSAYMIDSPTEEETDKLINSISEKENNRKLTYNSVLNLTVKDPDSTSIQIKRIALKYEGYAAELSSKQCVIRVPKHQLQNSLLDLEKLGKVTFKQTKANDITDQYYDAEIRLENAEKARQRYLELLAKAENVQAALLVEKELERLNGVIDGSKAQIKKFDQSEKFSSITINLSKKRILGPLGYIGKGIYFCVKWLFVIK